MMDFMSFPYQADDTLARDFTLSAISFPTLIDSLFRITISAITHIIINY